MGKVCVFFGTGYEEIEALTVVDLLRRENIETEMVSVTEQRKVTGAHQITVEMDRMIDEIDFSRVEMIVLPGGGAGTKRLEACVNLMRQVDAFVEAGKPVAAICAAPSILGHRGHLKGKKAIAYPGFEDQLEGAIVTEVPTIRDGNIITGRGMGCSIPFALEIVAYLKDKETSEKLAEKIIYKSQN